MQAQAVEVRDLVSETVTFWRPGADSPILKSLKDLDTSLLKAVVCALNLS